MNTQYLLKRRDVWFVRVRVPAKLRATIGKREIVRTLKTKDLAVANRIKHREVADIQAMFEGNTLPHVLQAATELRSTVSSGLNTAEEAEGALDVTIESHLDEQRAKYGVDAEGDPLMPAAQANVIRMAYKTLAGEPVALLSAQIQAYLKELRNAPPADRLRNQTIREKEIACKELQTWLEHEVEVSAVTRKVAGLYLTEKLVPKGQAIKTTKCTLTHLSALWTWMEGRGVAESNPWARISKSLLKSKRGKEAPRRPWTNDELVKLVKATDKDDPLFPLTVLAVYSGMRREEVCLLRKADIEGNTFKVREGKTDAAVRTVPIHPVIRPLVARLVKQTSDGYVIPGLLTGGMDKKRGHLLGKRFGNHIRAEGFADPALCFHTLRNTFINRCEVAGVPVSTTKLIVGHDREDLTYGGYSHGVPMQELQKAVSKVTFGALDAWLKGAAGKVKVDSDRSHRRTKSPS